MGAKPNSTREWGKSRGQTFFSTLALLCPTFFGKTEKFSSLSHFVRIATEEGVGKRGGRKLGPPPEKKTFLFPTFIRGRRAQKMEEEEAPLRKASSPPLGWERKGRVKEEEEERTDGAIRA